MTSRPMVSYNICSQKLHASIYLNQVYHNEIVLILTTIEVSNWIKSRYCVRCILFLCSSKGYLGTSNYISLPNFQRNVKGIANPKNLLGTH